MGDVRTAKHLSSGLSADTPNVPNGRSAKLPRAPPGICAPIREQRVRLWVHRRRGTTRTEWEAAFRVNARTLLPLRMVRQAPGSSRPRMETEGPFRPNQRDSSLVGPCLAPAASSKTRNNLHLSLRAYQWKKAPRMPRAPRIYPAASRLRLAEPRSALPEPEPSPRRSSVHPFQIMVLRGLSLVQRSLWLAIGSEKTSKSPVAPALAPPLPYA